MSSLTLQGKTPVGEIDFSLDVRALNARIANRKDNPYRWKEGVFNLPKGASPQAKDTLMRDNTQRFISAMAKRGWTLVSKPQYKKVCGWGRDIVSGVALLDEEQWAVRAIFATQPEPCRIEIPPEIVKQEQDHTVSLDEALKAWELDAPPITEN